MWLMLQQAQPDDFVIATGQTHTLEEFTACVFSSLGLDWREHVATTPSLFRPTDISVSKGNPAKAREKLGWLAQYAMADVVRMMVAGQQKGSPD